MLNLSARYKAALPAAPASCGTTITVQDRLLGGLAVLKLAPAGSQDAERLHAEGLLLEDLVHPGVAVVVNRFSGALGLRHDERVTGFATRWIDGGTITSATFGRPLKARLGAFSALLNAVAYLHRRGLVHLDLKPDNVLFSEDLGPQLLDFGSARSVHAAPGEAGGTLGYAAPELLVGQAASVSADLYSLGTILYELLGGRPPFGDLVGAELRHAVLLGDMVPLRLVAPELPAGLARLTAELLSLDPGARPASVSELATRLEEFGAPATRPMGEPPFLGRVAESAALEAALLKPGVVSLVGPTGSGRMRLARRALSRIGDVHGRLALDLTRADDPLRALWRLALAQGGELLPQGGDTLEGVRDALRRGGGAGVVFAGRREDLPAERLARFDELASAAAAGGLCWLWASRGPVKGATGVSLGGLADEELRRIGRFFGVPGDARVREAGRRAGGLPGPMARALAESATAEVALLPADEAAAAALASLPSAPPRVAVEALPEDLRAALSRLIERGMARMGEDGALYLDRHTPDAEVPEPLATIMGGLLDARAGELDPLWAGLLAARLGRGALAASLLPAAMGAVGDRHDELMELVRRVAEVGAGGARATLARLHLERGEVARAMALLAEGPLSPEERALVVRALRQDGRAAEAEAAARVALAEVGPSGALWMEIARCRLAAGDLDGADAATSSAAALDAEIADNEALVMEVVLASRRLSLGQERPRLAQLLARVEERSGRPGLSAATLSAAGRLMGLQGEHRRGEQLLRRAAAQADQDGNRRLAAGIRNNRAASLARLGQWKEARDVYQDALTLAVGMDAPDLQVRILYSLAELELRSGRLPAAERHLAAFRVVATTATDDEGRVRGQLLEGALLLARGDPKGALERLRSVSEIATNQQIAADRALLLARALLALGDAEAASALLRDPPESDDRMTSTLIEATRGRAALAIGRAHLAAARATIPDPPDPMTRLEVGEVLLAAAGEDLDPSSFAARRQDLDAAVHLLRGADAARAATLRDRLLEGPGAGLEGIVSLIQAMHSPQQLPSALARLMTDALGAHRVLITLRLPGLGQQLSYKELSGQEAAGISEEVLRRIQRPHDYWLSGNAFDDPHLRETSHTVRTFELKSLLAVAIPYDGRAVGALYVDDLVRADRFTRADVAMLQRLAEAVGRVLGIMAASPAQRRALVEPVDVFGVLLSDPMHVDAIRGPLDLLDARRSANLLITGPTGAGKTWFAQRVARERLGLQDVEVLVMRKGEPQWLVTQLAGTRKGEFTGALGTQGAIERALAGKKAIFLDEVQNLDQQGQEILLPLLDLPERRFGGLTGSAHPLPRHLHIILGTNVDVSSGRWSKNFREDLWYRMSRVHVNLPSLAERGPEVVYRYLAGMLAVSGAPAPESVFEPVALERVTAWRWPGNLRELSSFSDNAAALFHNLHRRLGEPELSRLIKALDDEDETIVDPRTESGGRLDQSMVGEVLRALRAAGWVQREAAKLLGIQPSRLNKLLKRYNLMEHVRAQRRASRLDDDSVE